MPPGTGSGPGALEEDRELCSMTHTKVLSMKLGVGGVGWGGGASVELPNSQS